MPTPTTVLEFAQNTVDENTAAKASATADASAAQAEHSTARTALDVTTAAIKAKEKEIAAMRIDVANADTPAEATTLAAELIDLIAERRALHADHLEGRDAVADAASAAALATSALKRIGARLASAQAELATAMSDDATTDRLKTAATAPPLDTLADDAGDARVEAPYTEAEARINEAIPPKLLQAARKAYEIEVARHARSGLSRVAAEDLLLDELETNDGVSGLVVRRSLELDRAERDLRHWSDGAVARFDRAIALLESVAAAPPLLSPAEVAGVQALDDAPAQGAADLRIALLDARQAVDDAQLDLDEATAAARAPDPSADVSALTEVAAAQAALDAANAAFTAARTDYDAEMANFSAWVAEVPDTAWRKLLAFIEADVILQELSDADPADITALIDAVALAEQNLAEALDAVETHDVAVAFLEDFATLRGDRLTRSSATHPERLFSAVRGDD
jgi:hypothetical protein